MRRVLVLGLAVVLCLGMASAAQLLSGEWTLGVEISPDVASFADAVEFSSELTVNYELDDWLFTSLTEFDDSGWSLQTFETSGTLGSWALDTETEFLPTGELLGFTAWSEIGLGGLTFDGYFELDDDDVHLGIGAIGTTDLLEIEVGVNFGEWDDDVCDLNWTGAGVDIDFPFCCGDVRGIVYFDCAGFKYAIFLVRDITLPHLPWVSFQAQLQFQTDSKNLVISPDFDFGEFGTCIEVYVTQENTIVMSPGGSTTLEEFVIDGISIECEIGGITITATSFWGTHGCRFWTEEKQYCDFPGILAGKNQEYWEAYRIATTDEGCCGPFGFDVTVFFHQASTSLFDVALFEANMSVQLSEQFTFGMGAEFDPAAGASEWRLDFTVLW